MPQPEGTPRPFANTPAEERSAQLSPDSRWIAYVSNETGRTEVYVQPFPATGAKWQVSMDGATQPQWRGDGRELYFLSIDKKLMAADVKPGGSTFAWGAPRVLMETRMTGWERINAGGGQYAVSSNGERFLISTATSGTTPITIAVNWPALLSR
jgi:Tol biopolymer transport system component